MSNYSSRPRQSLLGRNRPARNRTRTPPHFLLGSLGILGIPLAINGFSLNILNITSIPVYALFTMTRMTLAYLLSIGFALAYGITTGMNHRASHVMLPLLDVLQSVPVLGFLPPVFIFFISNFPGDFGAEVSSIILIFTA